MGDEHFLTSLYVHDAFVVRDLEIPIALPGHRRRHLMITGPNGSGKTSILEGLYRALTRLGSAEGDCAPAPIVEAHGVPSVGHGERCIAFMRAGRSLELHHPAGPASFDERRYLHSEGAAKMLHQFLVNLRTEQAFAREDGDQAAVDRIGHEFGVLEAHLRQVLDDDRLRLKVERPSAEHSSFEVRLVFGDGRTVGLGEVADGLASFLFIWSTLMIPMYGLLRGGIDHPAGWALIDEPELHLHYRVQELVMPLLVAMFPNVQFLVATYSPAVLASIPDATVFDLRSRAVLASADLQGIRYGTILTEHFGIETDFDRATTRKLHRLVRLEALDPSPGTPDFDEMHGLYVELGDRPHLLIARMRNKLEFDAA